jgi:hypothetical protein
MQTYARSNPAALRVVAALLLALLSALAGAVEPEAFALFLSRFCSDSAFRMERIAVPLKVNLGNKADGEPVREDWTKEEVARSFIPPLSASKLQEYGLAERVSICGSECREIFQYRREADNYLLSYQFQRRGNLWFLVEYWDESL